MHPIAFQFGSLTVTWYGIFVAAGFLAGLWTAARRAPLTGVKPETVLDLGPWLIVGAIIGSRAWYVVMFWDEQFAGHPLMEVFTVWRGGLVFYGGLVGAVLGTVAFAILRKLTLWNLADVLAPSIALGYVFGRMGCLLNGCCYGKACSLPWAIRFPEAHDTHAQAVHPTQVYDSLLNLALYAGLAWLYRHKKFEGQVFACYLVGFAVLRFTVELFRGDYPLNQHYLGSWATPAQVVSLVTLAAGVWLLLALGRNPLKRA